MNLRKDKKLSTFMNWTAMNVTSFMLLVGKTNEIEQFLKTD